MSYRLKHQTNYRLEQQTNYRLKFQMVQVGVIGKLWEGHMLT